ncbi:MAG: AtpZ/AtpI family protein [Myxococcota bacterium]
MKSGLREAGAMSTVGLEVVLSIMLPFLGGQWLDDKFETGPAWAIAGFVLGVLTAVRALYHAANRMRRADERDPFTSNLTDRPLRPSGRRPLLPEHDGNVPDEKRS